MRTNINKSKEFPPILIGRLSPTPPLFTLQASVEPTRKRLGEAAEAAFLARATTLGFSVCIPWGDSNRYDSVVRTRPRIPPYPNLGCLCGDSRSRLSGPCRQSGS